LTRIFGLLTINPINLLVIPIIHLIRFVVTTVVNSATSLPIAKRPLSAMMRSVTYWPKMTNMFVKIKV
jgi:hypothetical protein